MFTVMKRFQDLNGCSTDPEPQSVADSIKFNDPLLYIYTSGTTGLPKVHYTLLYVH